jgi:hypothetical protein
MKAFILLLCFAMLFIFGCTHDEKTPAKNMQQLQETFGYYENELDKQAEVRVDTARLNAVLNEILPPERLSEIYQSGYLNFYLRLSIAPDNRRTMVIFPDATYLERGKGVSVNPLFQQDIKYNFPKDKLFFVPDSDSKNAFRAIAGQKNGSPVTSLKSYEISTTLDRSKPISWKLTEITPEKFQAHFINKDMNESWFSDLSPLTSPDGFSGLRKAVIYPEYAPKNKVVGRVFVQIFADEQGNFAGYKLIKGLGYGCDEAVVNAITTSNLKGYPTGQRSSAILPFAFGNPQTSPIDLTVARFQTNPDKSNYCNLILDVVNKNKLTTPDKRMYWIYIYINNKLAFMNCVLGGVTTSYTQQTYFFHWKADKPGTFPYAIYIDPENRLNEENRENNTIKGEIMIE